MSQNQQHRPVSSHGKIETNNFLMIDLTVPGSSGRFGRDRFPLFFQKSTPVVQGPGAIFRLA